MTSLPRPRSRSVRLFAPAIVAVLALGGMACSGDDGGDDASSTTPSSETSTTTEAPSSTTDDDGDNGTTSTEGDDDATSTTEGSDQPSSGLASRLPEIEGYERDIDDDGGEIIDEHCDGSERSVASVEEVSADYQRMDGGETMDFLSISALRFSSDDDASTAYDEFVDTTSGCTQEGLTVDEGTSSGIGDEGMSWGLTFAGESGGALHLSRVGDELWFLSLFSDSSTVDEAVLSAFTAAAEG